MLRVGLSRIEELRARVGGRWGVGSESGPAVSGLGKGRGEVGVGRNRAQGHGEHLPVHRRRLTG